MLRLWGRISSINVRKVVLCAQVLGLDFERVDAGLSFGIVNTPDYRARNPNGLVPLLEDGDFTLWESNVIVRYLCCREGSSLYPQDIRQRFNAERWMDWQQTELNPAGSPAFKQWIRTPDLSKQAFMAGDALSMADIPIACEVHRWWGLPQPRPAWPNLERWYAQWLSLPASRGVLDLPLS